ncbi:DUF2059 domain-containing protein [Flavobacterium sp. RHBU_24]|uniref:DUF2059 domain-containing protein n=1 Tax=Flavobacterium sp. RHBU_24 TaxID=3391185 RepID=UPI003984F69F
MKKIFIATVFFLVANIGMAQDTAFKADVQKLLQLSGANSQMELAKKQVVTMIPAAKQQAFLKEFDAVLKPMVDKQVNFYIAEFTHDEVKQIIKFYESPLGKKMAEKALKQSEASMQDSQEIAGEINNLVMKYMQ